MTQFDYLQTLPSAGRLRSEVLLLLHQAALLPRMWRELLRHQRSLWQDHISHLPLNHVNMNVTTPIVGGNSAWIFKPRRYGHNTSPVHAAC